MDRRDADWVLEQLKKGNERFQNDRAEAARRGVSRRQELADGQDPHAIVLSCSDSRVSPEIAFDAGLGDLFVIRVAGNIANSSSIASIEYAVSYLGVTLVVVMGHESCGAVNAVLEGGVAGINLNHLLEHIQPAVAASEERVVDVVARNNVRLTAERLTLQSDIIRHAIENDGVKIVTAFYHLSTGAVEFD